MSITSINKLNDKPQSNQRSKSGEVGSSDKIIERIQHLAIEPLVSALAKVHDDVDNSLFKLAEKARNNNEQALYFDAMRKIRLNREAAEHSFKDSLELMFSNFPDKHYQNPKTLVSDSDQAVEPAFFSDEFSLIQNDDLEESIALDGMVSKARIQCKDLLYHLNTRLESLVSDIKVNECNNPLDPAQIAEAFMFASTGLGLDIKTKLLLYKQVDLIVMAELESVLKEANRFLIKEGVLPKLRRKVRKPKSSDISAGSPTPPVPASDNNYSTDECLNNFEKDFSASEVSDGVFEALSGLLQSGKSNGDFEFSSSRSSSAYRVVEENILLDMLSVLQKEQLDSDFGHTRSGSNEPAGNVTFLRPADVGAVLIKSLLKESDAESRSLGQHNEDVINLVSMLFEFILDDYNLPATVQVLLARLQIPILKIALLDPSFFDKHDHPARMLLNELARACIGLSEADLLDEDDLFQQVSNVVREILNQESVENSLFQKLYDEFKSYIDKKIRRTSIMEKRTLEKVYGQEKSQQVKGLVKEVLKGSLGGKNLPKVVSDILLGGWSRVLCAAYLSNGVQSPEWEKALVFVDNLIFSVQVNLEDEESYKKRVKILPDLINELYEGLDSVGISPFEISAQLLALEKIHIESFKVEFKHLQSINENHVGQLDSLEENVDAMVKEVRVAKENLYYGSSELPEINDDILRSLGEAKNTKNESLFDENEKNEITDTSGVGKEKTAIEIQKEFLQKQKSYMEQLESVEIGTWFEIKLPEVGKVRCKLAKKLEDVDLLVFVGRFGNKVLERSPRGFLGDISNGLVKELDSGHLFDRAIGKIFNRLGSDKKEIVVDEGVDSTQLAQRKSKASSGNDQTSKEIEELLSSLADD